MEARQVIDAKVITDQIKIQNTKYKMQNAKYKIQNAKALLLGNSPLRTKAGAKVEENRDCKNSKYKMECSLHPLFVQNTNSKGLASHCKAKTTFAFHFSLINA